MTRMSYDDRKEKILQAAREVFSEKGFDGASIKDIAKAADTSTALLYAYFDNKSALYEEVLGTTSTDISPVFKEMKKIGPGAKALVLCIFDTLASSLIIPADPEEAESRHTFDLLFCRSLVSNPDFATRTHSKLEYYLTGDFITECFLTAEEHGDLIPLGESPKIRMQMVMQLLLASMIIFLSGEPIYAYDMSREALLDRSVRFALRGIGMTTSTISKYYDVDEMFETLNRIHGKE